MADRLPETTIVPITSAVAAVAERSASAGNVSEPIAADRVQKPHFAGLDGVDAEANGAPRADTLSQIQVNRPDGRGVLITQVYVIQSGEYAIYQAGDVMVAFADDPQKAATQRKSILPLSPARAELNSLLSGLNRRDVCDRQLAYALQLALDGDLDGAKATIAAAKAFVLEKRAARGRLQYLKWSFGTAALLIVLLFIASWYFPFHEASNDFWLAAKGGLVGAAFSIALAIQGRTVALDSDLLDNATDGTLRLLIGVISAGVLLVLLASGVFPNLKIGDADLSGSALTWQMVLIIGFVAGFLERLVPDLLGAKVPAVIGSNTKIAAFAPAAH